MMKKKLALAVAAVALVGTLAVGGTLAWFTDTETATNVVTTGNVDVAWFEKGPTDVAAQEITKDHPGITFDKVVPGASLTKEAHIKNTGVNKALIRAKITTPTELAGLIAGTGTNAKWLKDTKSDWYYYSESVAAGSVTEKFITALTISGTAGNSVAGLQNLQVKLDAEALQLDNVLADKATYTLAELKGAFAGKTIADFETQAETTQAPAGN